MMQIAFSNPARISFYALLGSLIVPLGLFALLTALGFNADETPIVGFVFWLMLAITAFVAIQAFLARIEDAYHQQLQAKMVLTAVALMGMSIVFAKLSAHHYRETVSERPIQQPAEENDKYSDPKCRIVALGEHKATKLKETDTEGRVGWVFGLSNWYRWTLEIEIEEKNNNVRAMATSSGDFSPWYSMTGKVRLHKAPSMAIGTIACLWDEVQSSCKPIVTPGQGAQADKYWTSAAIVWEERDKGTSATVTAKASAAIGAESALEEVTVGVKGYAGAKMRLPASAARKIEGSESYSFRCISR
jgi:hypothetical protein